jgi:hypothetical protein
MARKLNYGELSGKLLMVIAEETGSLGREVTLLRVIPPRFRWLVEPNVVVAAILAEARWKAKKRAEGKSP